MHCPVCRYKDTKVVDSRLTSEGMAIRRRRECEKCGYRFSTLEELELLDLTVIKRDGRREQYHREKISRGLEQALRKRPYTAADVQKLVYAVERDLQKLRRAEVTSRQIGEIASKHLRKFDQVAYIRFASVYQSFEDLASFANELQRLAPTRKRRRTRRFNV